jgi:hypothetical protein
MPFVLLPRIFLFITGESKSSPESRFYGDHVETSNTISDQIFISTFDLAARMHEDLNEDQEMITLNQFGLLMLDWTDPQKAAEM